MPVQVRGFIRHLFPALAGMNRIDTTGGQTLYTVPRARGDEPQPKKAERIFPYCSPRSRG
mgnify:CR=1 FL=1